MNDKDNISKKAKYILAILFCILAAASVYHYFKTKGECEKQNKWFFRGQCI